ncbi:membrane fusion protein [Variovorax sp. YR266]|uniref:HlyD family secretion protein n=1 Tax=Variovorax sp. YR266 TaxID=1884386 RepID=UPI0008978AE2|nr:HlyD family efflux transporter periplasmic adaptor subunit [Variovorax sp. YR266]SDZ65646.1 membrane fusion protein [Variovorax sp. YR266]
MSLFRAEALNVGSCASYGPIVLARPWPSLVLVLAAGLTALLICSYLTLGSYTKRATAAGLLVPTKGTIRLLAATPGIVTQKRVEEGQRVRQGELLFVLSDDRRAAGASEHARLSDAQAASLTQRRDSLLRAVGTLRLLREQTQQGLRNRLETLREQGRRVQQEIELHGRRIEAATRMLERHRTLARERFISEVALQDKEDQVETLRAQWVAAHRQKAELTSTTVSVQSELNQTAARAEAQIAELERDLAALGQEVAEARTRDQLAVTAPMDGVITAITAQVGQPAGSQALATLLPADAELVAQLFAPSRAVGFVEAGQRVRIRYQAFPYQKFGQYAGVVTEVSRSPLQPGELSAASPLASASQEGLYRVTVKLESQSVLAYGKALPLMPGMALEADIEQERRRLIEWVLEPLIGLRKYTF